MWACEKSQAAGREAIDRLSRSPGVPLEKVAVAPGDAEVRGISLQ